MGVLRLLPEYVSAHWDVVGHAIEHSLPPVVGESEDKMNNILLSILQGSMECWLAYEEVDGKKIPKGFVVTTVLYDYNSGTSALLIYSAYAYGKVSDQLWTDGYLALCKYAKSKGCDRLVTYTNLEYLIEKAKAFNVDTYTFISFPIV